MTYNSYSSDTPSRKHPWYNDSFYDVLDMHQEFMAAEEKKAAEREQQIEEEKVRLRIAKVAQLHSKRVSVCGIAEAMGLPIEQVESDLYYIERSMNQAIQTHTANINSEEEKQDIIVDDYERARRKFHMTGFYEPKDSGRYVAIFH
jgi:ribosomal protein S24E